MKKIILFIVFLTVFQNIFSQNYIKSFKVFSAKSDFDFSNEWQYVSTDLYLFNSDKFNYLINILNPKKRGWHRRHKEQIKNILVTANLDGLGQLDKLTYPLFNFVVKKDDKGDYQTQISEPEAIRIVDNVPVSSVDDYIGAKIQIQIFSNKNRPEIYKFVSKQLTAAATITALSATSAALKVVGEIGKMMQEDAAGKQYQFTSTIRFYQEQNFDRRIHSISIYVFAPSYYYHTGFDTLKISEFFDTASVRNLTKEEISKLIDYHMFPYIVAVNYRSKYIPQISDDVNFQMLKMRSAKNERNYKNKAISRDIYLQEKSLIDFLNVFAQLQLDINNYDLNYKAKITNDYTIQLFLILQDYWKLKNTYEITVMANKGNPLFENEFKPLYNRYLTKADLKFEGNSSLRNVHELVETIYYLENKGSRNLDSAKREEFLRRLRAVKLPQRETNSDEATITRHWINTLENEQYKNVYLPKIDELSQMPVIESTYFKVQQFHLAAMNSYCELCKINTQNFVNKFSKEYEEYLFEEAEKKLTRLLAQSRLKIFEYSKKQSCIENTIDTLYSEKTMPDHIKLIKNTLKIITKLRQQLYGDVNSNKNFVSSDEINNYMTKIKDLEYQIETNLSSICTTDPDLCKCKNNTQNSKKSAKNE